MVQDGALPSYYFRGFIPSYTHLITTMVFHRVCRDLNYLITPLLHPTLGTGMMLASCEDQMILDPAALRTEVQKRDLETPHVSAYVCVGSFESLTIWQYMWIYITCIIYVYTIYTYVHFMINIYIYTYVAVLRRILFDDICQILRISDEILWTCELNYSLSFPGCLLENPIHFWDDAMLQEMFFLQDMDDIYHKKDVSWKRSGYYKLQLVSYLHMYFQTCRKHRL